MITLPTSTISDVSFVIQSLFDFIKPVFIIVVSVGVVFFVVHSFTDFSIFDYKLTEKGKRFFRGKK
jgi:hypothetical protein